MFKKINHLVETYYLKKIVNMDTSGLASELPKIKNVNLINKLSQLEDIYPKISLETLCKTKNVDLLNELYKNNYSTPNNSDEPLTSILKKLMNDKNRTNELALFKKIVKQEGWDVLFCKHLSGGDYNSWSDSGKSFIVTPASTKPFEKETDFYNFLNNTIDYFEKQYNFSVSARNRAKKEIIGIEIVEPEQYFFLPFLLETDITNTQWFKKFKDFSTTYKCVLNQEERDLFYKLIEQEKNIMDKNNLEKLPLFNKQQSIKIL